MESLQLIDLNKICRICLKSEMLVSIFSTIPFSQLLRPIDMIKKLDLFKLEIDENMTTSICQSCVYRVMDAFTLQQQCEATETRLRDYLSLNSTTASQYPYLSSKNYSAFSDFSDRLDEDNDLTKLGYHPSTPIVSSITPLSPPIFNTINCDIFETNNSEDIEVTDDVLNEVDESLVDVVGESLVFKISEMKKESIGIENNLNPEEDGPNFKNNEFLVEIITKSKEKKTKHERNESSKIFTCSECLKTFKSNILLEIHMRIHSDIRPYKCETCDKSFSQIGNFNFHKRTHTRDRRYQCEICSRLFSTSSNLKAHKRSHSDNKSFSCSFCDKSFKAKIELKRHLSTHNNNKEFLCNICQRGFLNKYYLKTHVDAVHDQKKKYCCTVCDKKFASSSNLIVHQRIHNGEKPFKCKSCDAKFNQSQALTRHEKLHTTDSNKPIDDISKISKPDLQISEEKSELNIQRENFISDFPNKDSNYKLNISEYLPVELINRNIPDQIVTTSNLKTTTCLNNNDVLNSSSMLPFSSNFLELQTNDINLVNSMNSLQRINTVVDVTTNNVYDFSKDIILDYSKNLHRNYE